MRKPRFNPEQIIGILKEADAGMAVPELCRKYGFSDGTYYKWKNKYGGMQTSDARRLKALEDENALLNAKINKLNEDTLNDATNNQDAGNSSFPNIEFEFGSDKLTPGSYASLDQIASTLNNNKATVRLSVQGYTDYIGTEEYNQKISVRRAKAVKVYLLRKNVPSKSVIIIGYGEKNPIATNETSEGRQKNRRVEYQITK